MTNEELIRLMETIRSLSLIPYPAASSDPVAMASDPRFYMALGIIAALATEAIDAYKSDRPIRINKFIPD